LKRLVLLLAVCLLPFVAIAQDDDRGRIQALIEDALSDGEARQVRIEGFAGALSSQATLDRMTISDATGLWLILENVQLDWTRTALLRGALEVNQLSAERLEILRLPLPGGEPLPDAAATPFSLPELPVSIEIGRVAIETVVLGEPVIGVAATLTVAGSLSISGGAGRADITLDRLDGPQGTVALAAAYSNETRQLSVDLLVAEDAGGLTAELLNLPGAPSVRLAVAGAGPLDDFAADIVLETDGERRVSGTVTTSAPEGQARITELALSGDVTPLFLPEYQDFFGPDVSLSARVIQEADGATQLENLRLSTAALSLRGNVRIDANGRPDRIAINGSIDDPVGRVRLPGTDVTIADAVLSLNHDSELGEDWHGSFRISQLSAADFGVRELDIGIDGSFTEGAQGLTGVTADITTSIIGLGHKDPDVAAALGTNAQLDAILSWTDGAPVLLSDLVLTTDTVSLDGAAAFDLNAEALRISLEALASAPSLSPFSGLADQDLAGAVSLSLSGGIEPLSGAFDLTLSGTGTDLRAGDAVPPELLAGDVALTVSAARDTEGLRLESFAIDGTQISASGSGGLSAVAGELDLSARLADVGLFTNTLSGPATVDLALQRSGEAPWDLTVQVTAPAEITMNASGTLSPDAIALNLAARAGNIGVFTDQISGPVTAQLTVDGATSGPFQISGTLDGPVGMQATVDGEVLRADGSVDLDVSARLPLSLANRALSPRSLDGTLQANLAISGQPSLSAVSGSFSSTGARVSLPTIQNALEGLTLSGSISGGRVQFTANGALATGGTTTAQGSLTLTGGGLPVAVVITLADARLIDPLLYEALITSAEMRISGDLAGSSRVAGTINLGETEIRVPETSVGTGGAIPEITHVGESAAERQSRLFAGLLEQRAGGGGGGSVALDLTINAPGRIFLRGRGLDAELGGQLRLLGTTADMIPSGRFELIRGRLSILGRRLDLDEGSASLRGSLDPYLRLIASSRAGDYTVFITLEGPTSEPTVSFSADPDLPDDEVLAQLLFGRSISSLSPLQALQLADAATSLAGGSTNAGLLSSLREGLGLDDLDLETDAEGNAGVRAGRYLSENIYTDVTVGADGQTDLSLNIDLTPDIAARGTFSSDGASSMGVFFERDY